MLKDELETIIASDEALSGVCTLILAAGIIGEYVAIEWLDHLSVRTLRSVFKRPRPSVLMTWSKRLKLCLEVAFAAMVVLGVTGEWYFSGRIAHNANLLRQDADAEVASAERSAQDAIRNEEELAETTSEFKHQALISQSALGNTLREANLLAKRSQPRQALLIDIGRDKRLVKYKGQRAFVWACGLSVNDHPSMSVELGEVEGTLVNELQLNAGWQVVPSVVDCPADSGQFGVLIVVSPNADETTTNAAHALRAALHDKLLMREGDNPTLSVAEFPRPPWWDRQHKSTRPIPAEFTNENTLFVEVAAPIP